MMAVITSTNQVGDRRKIPRIAKIPRVIPVMSRLISMSMFLLEGGQGPYHTGFSGN
jgi:hypothetical protein